VKKIIKKVEEPNVNETWICERCDHHHCTDCVEAHIVDFFTLEPSSHNLDQLINWKEQAVCPWCYNQLLPKKMTEKEYRAALNGGK
jgi:NAD-dependent dihydropyrimidine dehydrogenase PreA subunit